MAQKRMLSLAVVDSDPFLDLPLTTQLLYMHICMRADDDGFLGSPRAVLRITGCQKDDLRALVDDGYLLEFTSGVVAVTHWRVHNTLRKDRYTPTIYADEISQIDINDKKEYVWKEAGCQAVANWLPDGCQMVTTDKIREDKSKDSIDKISLDKRREDKGTPPKEPATNSPSSTFSDEEGQIIDQMLNHLKRLTGKAYKTDGDRQLVHCLLQQGKTENDIKSVIEKKAFEWGENPAMQKYLRPSTLFRDKFQQYLDTPPPESRKIQTETGQTVTQSWDGWRVSVGLAESWEPYFREPKTNDRAWESYFEEDGHFAGAGRKEEKR